MIEQCSSSILSVNHSHRSNQFQQMQGHDHSLIYHKDTDEEEGQHQYRSLLLVQQQMSKYADAFQHLRESGLYHQHSSYQFLKYDAKKH